MTNLIYFKAIFQLCLKGLNFSQSHCMFTLNETLTGIVTTETMCK